MMMYAIGRMKTPFVKAAMFLLVLAAACSTRAEQSRERARLADVITGGGHLEQALAARLVSLEDLEFLRDMAAPRLVSSSVRRALNSPLYLPQMADEALDVLVREPPEMAAGKAWNWAAGLLDATPAPIQDAPAILLEDERLSPELRALLEECLSGLGRVQGHLERAFGQVDAAERQYAAACLLVPAMSLDSFPERRALLEEAGIPGELIDEVSAGREALDDAHSATRLLDIIEKIDVAHLATAGRALEAAAARLREGALRVADWPDQVIRLETPLGAIEIGTEGDDLHTENAALILNPGGCNVYRHAGYANGLLDHPVCLVMDLSGDDFYAGDALLGTGAALWGAVWVEDLDGDDVYRARIGQASALFGVAGLYDHAGDDSYSATTLSQAAAYAGIAFLREGGGNNVYSVETAGQAYAGVRAVAVLADDRGDDVYVAGRARTDYERHWHRRLSLAQGFAIGMRPHAGGGVAILLDSAGNDTYIADVYGQGVSYWYAAGLLLDLAGHDTYRVYEYGQGAGIHLSAGLLADFAGDDVYVASSLAQGAAHDYGVGILLELDGNDTYTAERQSQGIGLNNSLGLLLDARGEDAYFARRIENSQGIGHFADQREYGSLSLLIDGGNHDLYSVPDARDGESLLRPSFGIIHDAPDEPPLASHVPVDDIPPPDLSAASFDELMLHIVRYGNTPGRRVNKEAARTELRARGPEALAYLLENLDRDNMWFSIYADDLSRNLDPVQASQTLLDALENTANPTNQRYMVYLLGHHATPQHADRIIPLLEDDQTAGSAIRTLGKWQITNSLEAIASHLASTNERRRITAVNALHDIRDDRAAPHLVPLLADPVFTVRYSAQRALSNLTVRILPELRPALESDHPFAPRLAEELILWKRE